MSQETEILESQNLHLTRENQALRQTLWDQFFVAALSGGCLSHGAKTGVSMAAEVADYALKVRNERAGVKS